MEKKKNTFINIPPEYIVLIGKCKSYFGNDKMTKLFFDNLKKLSYKHHSLLLKSIDFNVKKMKEGKISLESMLKTLTLKDDKKSLIEMVMNDFYIEYLDRMDLDFLKEKLNGDYINDIDLKSKEFFLDIIKYNKQKEMKVVNLNFSRPCEYKLSNYNFDEYINIVKNIMSEDFCSLEDAENYFNNFKFKELGCKTEEDYKNITLNKIQSIEKIKEYESQVELIQDMKNFINLSHKSNLIYDITKKEFIKNITVENFYEALPYWLPSFKKKNISELLFLGFKYKYGFLISLIGEVDYFLRVKNNIPIKSIHNFNNFFNIPEKYKIAKEILSNFDVRNKVCHGVFYDEELMQDSFMIYIIALDIFIGLDK